MDLIVNTNVFRHFSHMFDRGRPTKPFLDFTITKPLCPIQSEELQPFPRKHPEELGLSSRAIAAFLREVRENPELDLHGVSVYRRGYLLMNADFGAYRSSCWHSWHSLSKSVTATAIGMLIDEGRITLDDKVVKLLDKKVPALSKLSHKAITVRHLLTMTAGSTFSEGGLLVEKNWLRAYFEASLRSEPGTEFYYNSLNSYVLAAIVKEVTGEGLCEYLKPRLFDPLGITVYHWETSPEGIENGGWGLYLRREDAAKIGQLYLNGGLWRGKRLLSAKWIRNATRPIVPTSERIGAFDYGLHMWSGRSTHSFLFNGMFGQDLLAFPESGIMIVTNGGLEQLFQQSVYYDILFRYFGGKHPDSLPRDRKGVKQLEQTVSTLVAEEPKRGFLDKLFPKPLPDYIRRVLGKTFYSDQQTKEGIIRTASFMGTANQSLLPFVEQVLRNCYAEGIDAFTFTLENGQLHLRIQENKTTLVLPIAPEKTTYTVLRFGETDYHTAITSQLTLDEDGRGVLKLRLSFLEISSSRHIKIFFGKDYLEIRMKEMPGIGLIHYAVDMLEESFRKKKLLADVVAKFEPERLYYKVQNSVEPHFFLRLSSKTE